MGPTLVLVSNPTVARPVVQLLLRHGTAARPVLLWLLLLPRHATAARCHIVIPSLNSDSSGPPVPTITTDDKSMGVRWTFRELAENELNNL